MSGNLTDTNPSILGGGIPGFQPKLIGGGANHNSGSGMVGGGERSQVRQILREGWGQYNFLKRLGVINESFKSGLTPFRQAFNAGDLVQASPNYSGVGPNPRLPQINQINTIGASKLFANGGSVKEGGSAFSGNPHYVYDSSDYIRFKKLGANLKTYNDKSFGGSNNGSYSFIMNIRT